MLLFSALGRDNHPDTNKVLGITTARAKRTLYSVDVVRESCGQGI